MDTLTTQFLVFDWNLARLRDALARNLHDEANRYRTNCRNIASAIGFTPDLPKEHEPETVMAAAFFSASAQ